MPVREFAKAQKGVRPATISEFTELVAKFWKFDEASYPGYESLSDMGKRRYERDHVLKHLAKQCGALASYAEATDHSTALNLDHERTMTDVVAKLIVNALRLAQIEEVRAEQIQERILGIVMYESTEGLKESKKQRI
jgi:hypothetical protein